MKITSECFFCVELLEEHEKTTLCNLDMDDALGLCMRYVARYSHLLDIPVPIILQAIKMGRVELLHSGVNVERHIYRWEEGEPCPFDEEGEIEKK